MTALLACWCRLLLPCASLQFHCTVESPRPACRHPRSCCHPPLSTCCRLTWRAARAWRQPSCSTARSQLSSTVPPCRNQASARRTQMPRGACMKVFQPDTQQLPWGHRYCRHLWAAASCSPTSYMYRQPVAGGRECFTHRVDSFVLSRQPRLQLMATKLPCCSAQRSFLLCAVLSTFQVTCCPSWNLSNGRPACKQC
jgi:hypothetical protein